MAYLNHIFFKDVSGQAVKDDEKIINAWQDYLKTIPEKEMIVKGLEPNKELFEKLTQLLKTELFDLSIIEHDDKDIISCLQSLKATDRIKRIALLEDRLTFTKHKYQYTYELLLELFTVLKTEHQSMQKLMDSDEFKKHKDILNSELGIEKALVQKIGEFKDIHRFLLALAKGEHMIHIMDSDEHRLIGLLKNRMSKIFSQEITEGVTIDWALTLYNTAQDKIAEEVAKTQGGNVDFEFVNKPEFYKLARAVMEQVRKKPVSDKMLNVLVYLFREWYNYERGETHE